MPTFDYRADDAQAAIARDGLKLTALGTLDSCYASAACGRVT